MTAAPFGTPLDAFVGQSSPCGDLGDPGNGEPISYPCTRPLDHLGDHVATSGPDWQSDYICSWPRSEDVGS